MQILNIHTTNNPNIIVQSDDIKLKNEEQDVENPTKPEYEQGILDEGTNESVLRSRRQTTFPKFSDVANRFKNIYKSNRTNKKSDENEYDIEAGIMLLKNIITKEKGTKKYYILLSVPIILFFVGFLIYYTIKGFYDETAIE
jgi:hypothetical protein